MHLGVAHFGLTEYFTDEVDRSLHLVDVSWLVSLDDQDDAHHISGGGDVQEKDFPIFWCCLDRPRGKKILELLECFGSIIIPLKLVGLLEKFEEG